MNDLYIVDGHCDSLIDFVMGKRSLQHPREGGQWDIPRALKAGVALQFLAAYIETEYKPDRAISRGLQLIEGAHQLVRSNKDQVFLIQGRDDLNRLPDSNGMGVLLSVEGGEIIGENPLMLKKIYEHGVRALGLTWNQRNSLGDGVGVKGSKRGLTKLGEVIVQEMNNLGMLIDVSHLNEAGYWQVLELSKDPIAATHSCSRSLCDHPRNLTDQQLRALGRKKGVVGVNFFPEFLSQSGSVTRRDVVRHICHIADIAGVESVGLGSDFDGISDVPAGLTHVGEYPALIEDLGKAGFSNRELGQILGGNFIRLLRNVLK